MIKIYSLRFSRESNFNGILNTVFKTNVPMLQMQRDAFCFVKGTVSQDGGLDEPVEQLLRPKTNGRAPFFLFKIGRLKATVR
jgi:hypothetical protein